MATAPVEALEGIDLEELAKRLPEMSDEEKRELLISLKPLSRSTGAKNKGVDVPQTPDELWDWIKRETGYEIPRVAVCDDHCAPFDFVVDCYFEHERALLLMAGREGGKTISVAIVHYANSETKPGCESCTFGAIEPQAKRAYKYVKDFIFERNDEGKQVLKPQIDGEPLRSETVWKTGSKIEILVGSKSGVNSPHPQKVHADEVDLMEVEVWEESQPVDLVIPTPQGPRCFGDLRLGDEVFDRDGRPTAIEKINELGEREVYRVELTDGRTTECCADHLWLVGTKSGSKKRWHVKRASEIMGDLREPDPRGGFKYRYRVPQQGVASYQSSDLPLHPYVLGVLLGDGCLKRRLVNFRANDQDIVERVDELLPVGVGVHATAHDPPSYRVTRGRAGSVERTPNPVVAVMEELGLEGRGSHDKFLPRCYLEGTEQERLELLRGLMDTDGSFSKDPYFATVSEELALGIRELVLSLGGRALMRKKKTSQSSFDNCGYIYEVSTSLPDGQNPFGSPTKAKKFKPRQRTLAASIRSITPLGRKQVRCIGVAAEDGLYLTSDYVVTHNSRNMASSKKLPDGTRIRAQDIATSTRKSARGLMQQLIDEVEEAERNGHKPAWKLYSFCIFEVSEEVPYCRRADPKEREARLTELDRDPCELCECDKNVKGEWAENEPRTLESVCRGKFFRSRGWMPHEDVVGKFMQNSQVLWEAQQECRRPSADGLYLPTWTRQRFCVREWQPTPDLGSIYMGVDWGGSAESAIVWIQGPLRMPVEVMGFLLEPIVVPEGGFVVFAEIQKAGIGATKLGDMVVAREHRFRQQYPGWRVKARFADMAGRQQRDDWREHDPPLLTHWYLPSRDFDPTVRCMQDLVADSKFFIDAVNAPILCDEVESWRQKNGKEVAEFNHGCAATRYCTTNVTTIERRRPHGQNALPVVRQRQGTVDPTGATPTAAVGSRLADSERWRERMGHPVGSQPWGP